MSGDYEVPANILHDFVPSSYAESKRNVLLNGLRSLRRIYSDEAWETWMGVLNAYTLLTEEVAAEVEEPDFRNVDSSKGSAFQRRFALRWESYESLLMRKGSNHKPLTKTERSCLRFLVKTPKVISWRSEQSPHKQRKMTHPNTVINAWKAQNRDTSIDPVEGRKPDLQQRIILDLDNQVEQHRKEAAELRTVLEDHDWNCAQEVSELLRALKTKLRNRTTGEQWNVLVLLAKDLGFADLIKTIARTK